MIAICLTGNLSEISGGIYHMKKLTNGLLAVIVLIAVLVAGAQAASIDNFRITPSLPGGEDSDPPGEGTSNTIYTIQFNWHETDGGRLPIANSLKIGTYVPYVGFTYYVFPQSAGKGSPAAPEGRLYEFRVTAGLNFRASYPNAYPPAPPAQGFTAFRDPTHPIADLQDVYYLPGFVAKDPVAAMTVYVVAADQPPPGAPGDPPPAPVAVGPETCEVIIHDSHPTLSGRYAGQSGDRDFLYAYYAYNDATGAPKPIQSFGLNENFQWREPDDAANPDDGSTSTCWEFRVIYQNSDNLPPIPYMSGWGGAIGDGFVFKRPDPPEASTGVVLYLKNKSWDAEYPNRDFIGIPMQKANPGDNDYTNGVEYVYYIEPQTPHHLDYVGLPIGEYEWFIGCSDDYIRTKNGGMPDWLDPAPEDPIRRAFDTPFNRSRHGDWRSFMDAYNTSLYLDRPTLQPGVSNPYDYPADDHPVVSIGLQAPQTQNPGITTVSPVYMMVNPQTGWILVGGAQNQKWDFPIMYQHLYGVTPEQQQGSGGEISVWVNNSNTRTPNANDPSTQYRRFTLVRSPENETGSDVKHGVVYKLPNPIELLPGPHSYFFTASDGLKRVRYPVEGHHYEGQHAFYGPYVNHKPVLENPSVDPPTGTAGDKFRYTVTYKDADNQRPYSAKIFIEFADGQVIVGEMIKENPADSDFDGVGVKYIFDTANMAQQFQEGQRRFYFEFVDDWGAVTDTRDQRRGEAVYWNSARPESWIFGPYINRNTIPQLLDGSVVATDGANNSATLFEYSVRYVDIDNHAPKYLDVYIGQVQANGSISWDHGHLMDPADPSDDVYSGDGALFRYSSRLTGEAAGKDYYYCFVASDRYDVAEYDAVKSPSAGTIWFTRQADGTPLYKGERQDAPDPNAPVFTTAHKPIVGPIPDAPTENPYSNPLVFDGADNEVGFDSIDYINGLISTDPVLPTAYIQYWFATAGPTNVGVNHAPALSSGSVSPNPGASTSEFTYRVTYSDQDGTMGQPPYYIRVRIDGTAFDMTRAAGGEPNYKNGVTYFYRTTALTPQLPHHYYFEASDGSGFAVFDNTGGRSSDNPIGAVTWIPGPYVNNKPTLTAPSSGAVFPTPGSAISTSQWVNFGVVYTDANNEWPTSGTPVVFIRKVDPSVPPIIIGVPPEPLNDFKVRSFSGTVVTAENLDGSTPTWTVNEFAGLPLQFTNGTASGTSYRVESNTANTVTLLAQILPGVAAGNAFSIGKIQLSKDPNDNNCANGAEYTYRLNSLGEGDYAVHFMSSTNELIGEGGLSRTTVVRYPAIGEITNLRITKTAPLGNLPPLMTKGLNSELVTPQIGLAGGLFTFKITYSDANGDAPIFRDADYVTGYVKLFVDGALTGVDMTGPAGVPNYVTGAEFTAVVDSANPLLTPGKHTFHFEGSDGWVVGRYPILGVTDPEFYINRKPVLLNAAVTPTYGNAGMSYEFTVTYKDADNRAPDATLGYVRVWVNGISYAMTLDTSAGTDFVTAGVRYHKTLAGSDLITSDDPNANSFYVTASDGLENAVQTATINGPLVHVNHAPELSVGMVNPTSRWTDTVYTYSVIYSDDDGDLPEYVKLDIYINGAGAPLTFDMVKVANQNDFETGVTYTYAKQGLPAGTHTFVFRTKDFELENANPAGGTGPSVTSKPVASVQVNQPATAPRIGVAGVLTGSISPARSAPLTLTFKRPDDSQFTRTVTTGANGIFSTSWTPDMIGVLPGPRWSVKATWAGDADYAQAESAWVLISVTGPSSQVRGLDMISIPIHPANAFPGSVFGDGSYALAQFRPLQNDYAYYRSVPGLPGTPDLPLSDIELGGGYWMKVYGGTTMTVSPSREPGEQHGQLRYPPVSRMEPDRMPVQRER